MKIAIASAPGRDDDILPCLTSSAPGHEVAWSITNENAILDMCLENKPDLLLLDLSFTKTPSDCVRKIMESAPCLILLATSTVAGNEPTIFEAMRWGALDVATIPASSRKKDCCKELLHKIEMMSSLAEPVGLAGMSGTASTSSLVAIGASTGGPSALRTILAGIPGDFQGNIVVVQHIDAEFLPGLASWLNSQTELEVEIAEDGDKLKYGKVLIAGGPDDLIITKDKTLEYVAPHGDAPFHPSIDALFRSCVDNLDETGVSVILSGMGKDGVAGMKAMSDAGWQTIAQDEATSAIYGMPKAAALKGAAKHIIAVDDIARAILKQTHYRLAREEH